MNNVIKYEVIRISGVAVGVGVIEKIKGVVVYAEKICETLFETGDDENDAAASKKYATLICNALNYQIRKLKALKQSE